MADATELRKLAIGAAMAACGAVLTYATTWATNADLGPWTPVVVAVLSIAANLVRKLSVGPELKDEVRLMLAGPKPEPAPEPIPEPVPEERPFCPPQPPHRMSFGPDDEVRSMGWFHEFPRQEGR